MARRDEYAGFDLFPASGPVREYKPLILKESLRYSGIYYLQNRYRDVLAEAVRIAVAAQEKYDPERSKFGTLLRSELRRLHRWCQAEYRAVYMDNESGHLERKKKPARALVWQRRGDMDRKPLLINYARWKEARGRERWPLLAQTAAGMVLKNEKQRAMLDWMVGDLLGRETRTMAQAAAEIGITKGYASKLVGRIARNIKLL